MTAQRDYPALVAEARDYADPGLDQGYRPFDQEMRVRHFALKLEQMTVEMMLERNEDISAWERAHGHDIRLKCYPEFQCQAIQGYEQGLIHRLAEALASSTRGH